MNNQERPDTANEIDSEGAKALTAEIVQQNLGVLGKNPYSLNYVYTTASLLALNLTDLSVLGDFPHIQHVLCSKNRLRTLAPLSQLKLLLSVDASHNQLTHALDFDVPKCTPENAWVGGGEWIGSLLRRADLSFNVITSIRDLGATHPFLLELNLSHNAIREMRGIAALRFLRVLDLSHNRLTSTRGLLPIGLLEGDHVGVDVVHLEALEVLRLSHNQIPNIDEVVGLPRLVELDLAHNRLNSICCLEHCYRLQKLNLAHNELASVNDVNFLLPLPFLQTLVLAGCPFTTQEVSSVFYRARVLRRLQQLVLLDDGEVSAKEKVKALAMHGSEIASRREVLAKLFPTEDFVNYLPPLDFEEDEEFMRFYEERFGQRPETGAEDVATIQ